MTHSNEHQNPIEYGGFRSRENQLANTAFRGMEDDATAVEVAAYDRMQRDLANAAHFDYPIGTTSAEIGYDLLANK